eukprot:c15798_g2_i1 orf=2-310(-)
MGEQYCSKQMEVDFKLQQMILEECICGSKMGEHVYSTQEAADHKLRQGIFEEQLFGREMEEDANMQFSVMATSQAQEKQRSKELSEVKSKQVIESASTTLDDV